jgi:hypothetical protein
LTSFLKSKKVVIPGLDLKEIKPLSFLLTPMHFLIPMLLSCLISQISDNLKGVLSFKDIQQLPSVKIYSRLIAVGFSSVSLSVVYSISKSLSADLELFSILSPKERVSYISSLEKKIMNEQGPGKLFSGNMFFQDPLKLLKYRRGLCLQFRSILSSTSLFSPHTLTIGISIKDVTLKQIVESCKLIWLLLDLELEEFEFVLRKEALLGYKKNKKTYFLEEPKTSEDCLKLLFYFEIKNLVNFENEVLFSEDQVVLRSENNLTSLESSLGFIKRLSFYDSSNFSFSDHHSNDIILRAAFQQHNFQKRKMQSLFYRVNQVL